MSFRNILFPYAPFMETLAKAEILDQGSEYEHKAIIHYSYLEGLHFIEPRIDTSCYDKETAELTELCKAEAKTAMPNLSETELNALAESRNKQIRQVALELVKSQFAVLDALISVKHDEIIKSFKQQVDRDFNNAKMDQFVDEKLEKLDPAISTTILKSVFEKAEVKNKNE